MDVLRNVILQNISTFKGGDGIVVNTLKSTELGEEKLLNYGAYMYFHRHPLFQELGRKALYSRLKVLFSSITSLYILFFVKHLLMHWKFPKESVTTKCFLQDQSSSFCVQTS